MHTLETSGTSVPAFLAKLWRLVEETETNSLISWSEDGKSFVIRNQAKFAKELLPLNYKHNNMASFIRQLNMYGFHKITSIDNGGLKFDKDEMEFSHPYFQKGHPYLLEHIKRKIANPKQAESEKVAATKVEHFNRVLHEVKNMRGRQDSLDTRFSAMKQENEALWREVAILRQKHMKQQQIVNKLIQFLVTIVQPQRSGLGSSLGKRRYQLMINDAPQSKVKKATQNHGPIISELTEELLDDSDLETDPINFTNVLSPGSQSSKDMDSSAGSSEGALSLDDIDEIDTNNMAIYSGAPVIKKEKRSGNSKSSGLQKHLNNKKETNNLEPVIIPSSGKSLLLPMPGKAEQNADQNIMIDILNEDDAGLMETNDALDNIIDNTNVTSTLNNSDPLVPQNLDFDQSSQDANILANNDDADDLFKFVEKKGDDSKVENNALRIMKYNPPHNNDILGLQSHGDYSTHLENVQTDLDSLKDILRGDAYQLDSNQLLGNGNNIINSMQFGSYDVDTITKLFGNEDIIGYELPSSMDLFEDVKKDDSRSELIEYQPFNNNLDLNELLQNVGDGIDQGNLQESLRIFKNHSGEFSSI